MRHEINLLPPAKRKRLRQRWLQATLLQVLRHIQISLIVLTIIGVGTGAGLKAMLTLTSANSAGQIQSALREYQTNRVEINNGNQLAGAVTDFFNKRITWSDHLRQLLEVLPPNTTIEQVQAISEPPQLLFSGTSINRNSLVILQSRLEALPWAARVNAPLQNLLDRERPEYSFTIHVASGSASEEEAAPRTSAAPQASITP